MAYRKSQAIGYWARSVLLSGVVFAAAALVDAESPQPPAEKNSVRQGRDLFTHRWAPNDPQSAMGDGLGPVYNERSCVACHYQGGVGGGGPDDNNVDVLSVRLPSITNPLRRQEFEKNLADLHAGFQTPTGVIPSITLHAHGTLHAYYQKRRSLLEKVVAEENIGANDSIFAQVADLLEETGRSKNPTIRFQLTQRNTPALFGAGLLDQVSERTLDTVRRRQSKKFPKVSGRIARINQRSTAPDARNNSRRAGRGSSGVTRRVGRFGWRGQTPTLNEFVRGACANELGLAVSTQPQPVDPTNPQTDVLLDLTDRQCRDLLAYVANLPAPKPKWPDDEQQRELSEDGQVVFDKMGCIACHVESLGPAEFVYSDLLLHDLGPSLSDPFPAPTDRSVSTVPGYYGGLMTIFSSTPPEQTRREWRTPPLWGVADSGPYLHDGRAETLTAAIVAHDGEARFATINYLTSSSEEQLALLAFLSTLRAPDMPQAYEQPSEPTSFASR
jgi:CxxC motif-containing protein (DUF1111 family)